MSLRTERIPEHKLGLAKLLDDQIKALEDNGDLKTVFDEDEQWELRQLGHAKYLAELKETRRKLGQPDGLGGE